MENGSNANHACLFTPQKERLTKDVRYQEIVIILRKTISTYCESFKANEFSGELKRLCIQELQKHNLLSDSLDKSLIEVLYYEQKFS